MDLVTWLADTAPATTSAAPGTWTVVLAILAALGGVGGIAALVMLPNNRRKIDAETTHVFTQAALDLVKPLQDQVAVLQHRVDVLEDYKTKQNALLITHASWDAMAVAKLAAAGIEIPVAPPLYPSVA